MSLRRSVSVIAAVALAGGLLGFSAMAIEAVAPVGAPVTALAADAAPVTGGLGYTSLPTACRAVDTRNAGGVLAPGGSRNFRMRGNVSLAGQGGSASGCGVPANASAVEVTFTAVTPSGASGFVQAFPAGSSSRATVLNYTVGRSITNTGTIPLNTTVDNDLGVANAGGTIHVIVDVQGYFSPTGGASYVPLPSPCRIVDTRNAGGTLGPGGSRSFRVRTQTGVGFEAQGGTPGGCGIPDDAGGVELSLSVTTPTVADGFIRIAPDGSDTSAAFANYTAGTSITNTGSVAIAASATLDIVVRNFGGTTHVVLDVQGFYTTTGGGTRYQTVTPCRTVDTRNAGGPLAPGRTRTFQTGGTRGEFAAQGTTNPAGCGVPQRAAAVEASVTAVNPTGVGFTRPGPAGSIAAATFLNYSAAGGITNTGTIPLALGGTTDLAITNLGGSAAYLVDVLGYYEPPVAFPRSAETVSGGNHNCVVVGGGQIRCWGNNQAGEIGDGTTTVDRAAPVTLNGYTGAVQIGGGEQRSCALFADGGTVRCWGSNSDGGIGDGTTTGPRTTPTLVAGLNNAVQISTGDSEADHTCALVADGTVRCWGRNDRGQVGNGVAGTTPVTTPTTVPGLTGVAQVESGGLHTCAVLTNGTVRCWGFNTSGQLGNGVAGTTPVTTPTTVPGLSGVVRVSLGSQHTCALLADGTVRCWGSNAEAQLGNGQASSIPVTTPSQVTGLSGATRLGAFEGHTCALLADGTARCWGFNGDGQLGDGTTSTRTTPVPVSGLTGALEVGGGEDSTCALLAAGTVRCWGGNSRGQIGDGTTATRLTPTAVAGFSGVVQVAVGGVHSCALAATGTVRCWGSNSFGQVGDGTTSTRTSPVPVSGLAGVVELTAGDAHTCALVVDGTVRCWGSNGAGAIGDASTTDRLAPVTVPGLAGVVQISAGGAHTCALLVTRVGRCWGNNFSGQIGNGASSATPVTSPVAVSGLTGAVQIAAGLSHTCATLAVDAFVLVGGGARCWGSNGSGQQGTGSTSATPVTSPTLVTGLNGTMTIDAGASHTCVTLTDGTARCWGRNSEGQVGDNTVTPRPSPTPVSEILTSGRISAGGNNTCSTIEAGEVRCWGPTPTGPIQALPTAVILSGGTQVSEGGSHRCAAINDGSVRCWGSNGFGQIGNGVSSATPVTSPVAVPGAA